MRDYARLYQDLLFDLSFCETSKDQEFFTSDQTLRDVRAITLLNSFYKKLAPKGQSKDALDSSLAKFCKINDSIATNWQPPKGNETRCLAVEYWKQNFAECIDFRVEGPNFDLEYIRDNMKPGPGASIGANADTFYTKMFDGPLSCTHPYLIALFRAAISESQAWFDAESIRHDLFGFEVVEGNRLFFVPKNSKISRTCCTEASLNMLFQQAMGRFLETRLKMTYQIDLSTQPDINRHLAKIGSNDGSYATIDLASASDSIGWSLMQKTVPNNLLGYFRLFRSPATTLPGGKQVPLNMISTMGNGFTFPLQTIIFASAVKAIYQLKGFKLWDDDRKPMFSVFGDDIIVRSEAYLSVVQLLEDLGFTVNDGKSFHVGHFRESCGFDYFKGVPVRGVFIETLETSGDVYSAFNRLTRWSAVSGIEIPSVLRRLLGWARFLPIPISWGDDEGFKVPSTQAPGKACSDSWFKFTFLGQSSTTRRIPGDFVEARSFGYKGFNPHGWAVCFLGGYAHNPERVIKPLAKGVERPLDLKLGYDLIGYRPARGVILHRRHRKGMIPYWDYYDDLDPRFPARFLDDWKIVLARTM